MLAARHQVSKLLAAAACAATAAPALAQTAPERDPSPTVGEVIVTATRRAEPLERVPVAVSVVDGQTALRANLNNLRDIASIVPSLNVRTAASSKDQGIIMRGLGTISTSPGVEPTVSTVVDGVVFARQGQAVMDLIDIDHIEVLRGPQGTLFGKNASGGVVNIVSRNPTQTLTGFADLAYYGGNEERLQAGVSGPLAKDKASALITVLASNFDGNVTNVWNGEKVNGYTRVGARGKLLLTPSDAVKVLLAADFIHTLDTSPQGVVAGTYLTAYPTNKITTYPAFANALAPVTATPGNVEINSNYNTHYTDDNWGVSGQVDWTFDGYTLTSISAYREWNNTQFQDQDRLPGPVAGFPQQHDRGDLAFNQTSQELRLASPKGHFVDYVVGFYFMRAADKETYRRDTTTVTAAASSLVTGIADYGVTDLSYSAFGEANLNFTPQLRAIAGARVIHDDIRYDFDRVSTSPVAVAGIQTAFASSGSTDKTGYAGRLGLQYDFSPKVMGYVTYSRGYKGPAYNVAFSMLPQDAGALKPETSDAYEAGIKSRLFADRVMLNADIFHDTIHDYQVNFYDTFNGSPITRLINAGQVSTRGAEADFALRPTTALTINGAAAYVDAHVDQFACPPGASASCDINGGALPFSPKWKMVVSANYRLPLTSDLSLDLNTDFNWRSSQQYSINQTVDTIQPAYGIWNASVALSTSNGWRLAAVVKNITDKSYSTALATFGSGFVRFVPRDNRRYAGVSLHKSF